MMLNASMMSAEQPILQVRDLVRTFGGLVAVNDFSLDVYPGSIHGLIGPNGAGKTTTFNVISGFYAPSSGKIIYLGQDVSGRKTNALAALGLIRTFQGKDNPISSVERARQCPPRLSLQRQGRAPQPYSWSRPSHGSGSWRESARRAYVAAGSGHSWRL
jgi:energy-coupling factor transporter ATP-binding protein EcfA2